MTIIERYSTAQVLGDTSWDPRTYLLHYNSDHPFTVSLRFPGGIEWLVDRDDLLAGTEHPVGAGDVRLWPTHDTSDALFLLLRSRTGEAFMELARGAVLTFVKQTEELVPRGQETAAISMDDELAKMLGDDS